MVGHSSLFPFKRDCPAYSPRDHWVRKSLSFREELKVKFGVFYETVIFLSKFKFLLHRYYRKIFKNQSHSA